MTATMSSKEGSSSFYYHCYYHNHHFFLICIGILLHTVAAFAATESEILVNFKRSLVNSDRLSSWDESNVEPCAGGKANWVGVICWNENVWGLRLENMGLAGIINIDPLRELRYLRALSFQGNNFGSTMPDFNKIPALKALFLSNNHFSGEIADDAFENMPYMKKVHLANNRFIGTIPTSLADLPRLLELRIEGNQFEGPIPDFKLDDHDLKTLNLSNNFLEGPIPDSLSKMDASAFQGNRALCGAPLEACQGISPFGGKTPSILIIVIVAIVVLAALISIGAMICILIGRKRSSSSEENPSRKKNSAGSAPAGDLKMLSFLREDRATFDMPDLLKASAEILGSGSFGASYKAALGTTGPIMVVKRFKKLNNVGRQEFGEHMKRLGKLTHPNVLPTVAYYYKKEEKLFITDFVENGSLAICLHGYHSVGQPSLDWPTRLKIVKGVTKGLEYLYNELPSLTTPHGHLKSSNVLLSKSHEPVLHDYGLIPVVNHDTAREMMVAYKSPEYAKNGRVTKKTDVWALGMLILEILTGRFPANFLHRGKGKKSGKGGRDSDLVSWVMSVFHGEFTREVIDKEMVVNKNNEGEILKLLKLGLACSCEEVDKRLEMKEAAHKIEQVKEVSADDDDDDGDNKTSNGSSEGDVKSAL